MARANIVDIGVWVRMAQASGYDVDALSKEMRVSVRQLHRYTHRLFGRSPKDWLDEQRLCRAAAMLTECRLVKAVALDLGYKHVSHFSRQFKLHYGLSPTAYLDWSDGASGLAAPVLPSTFSDFARMQSVSARTNVQSG